MVSEKGGVMVRVGDSTMIVWTGDMSRMSKKFCLLSFCLVYAMQCIHVVNRQYLHRMINLNIDLCFSTGHKVETDF